ncbi:murein hydrolase transporter LrgA [Lentilactobacillus fungorum]|uniref:Murein hydrolase transporter LrgA n=1 Tax=Lentilactobacillus fungorum TaxID=2201250 RepID=A0ABQ3VZB6_9LACO|nr:CidA/LrgA family protein [Lentilactobacillus fungorum]GHP13546.1 murein hydrolase transporter LrgA [Lentilactobacillus fungorum]
MASKQNSTPAKAKGAPVLIQMGIFAGVLFVSSLISPLFPPTFPVPTPVIGLIILYLLLTFHIVKLEWVDNFATFMISMIAFLFVPSGIQLTASLGIMKAQGVRLIIAIIISTIVLLVVTAFTTSAFIWIKKTIFHGDVTVNEKVDKK